MICTDCGIHIEIGMWPLACAGMGHELGSFWQGDSNLHTSEKVVVYEHSKTGDLRIPGRGDRPIHPKLAAAGYERKVLDTVGQVREVEKKKNLIHERSNYNQNSTLAERDTGSS